MFKIAATLLPLFFFISCTGARKPNVTDRGYTVSFDENWYVTVEVPFEEAWGTAISALHDQQFSVETQDRTSLTIRTQFSTGRGATTGCVPPGTMFSPFKTSQMQWQITDIRCRLIVRPVPSGETTTKVDVLAKVQAKFALWERTSAQYSRQGQSGTDWLDCESSSGQIEKQFFDAFLTRLEPIRYDPPVYRRGR